MSLPMPSGRCWCGRVGGSGKAAAATEGCAARCAARVLPRRHLSRAPQWERLWLGASPRAASTSKRPHCCPLRMPHQRARQALQADQRLKPARRSPYLALGCCWPSAAPGSLCRVYLHCPSCCRLRWKQCLNSSGCRGRGCTGFLLTSARCPINSHGTRGHISSRPSIWACFKLCVPTLSIAS